MAIVRSDYRKDSDLASLDGFVKNPISAFRVSLVIAAYRMYAAFGTRDSGIPQDSQAVTRTFYETVWDMTFYEPIKS